MIRQYSAMLAGAGLAVCLVGTASPARAASYKMLYAFQGGADGQYPIGRLAPLGTYLFGVTGSGGNPCNCGTVYRLSGAGAEHVIHTFAGAPNDGASPQGGLAVLGTSLYGTTSDGGANNCEFGQCGTIFRVRPNGAEKIIHDFNSGEAFSPAADLLAVGDAVWGTSPYAGGAGAVFKTQKSGNTTTYDLAVGEQAIAGVLKAGGAFYGTTFSGGFNCGFEEYCGTVYKMTPDGQSSEVYAFQGGADGSGPDDNLVYSHGALYGTTSGLVQGAKGTVFKLTLSGAETVLHAFSGGSDGAIPLAGLTEWNGTFYGTTASGGGTGCGGNGCGTIFSITPDGSYKVLYQFQGGADGQAPASQMIVWNGALYGTTSNGGGGTVFRLKP